MPHYGKIASGTNSAAWEHTPPRSGAGPVLTAAEQRVADLVAAGRTNAEIAAELFMGQRTVEAHLSRVYRKLAVRSRTELCRILVSPSPPRAS